MDLFCTMRCRQEPSPLNPTKRSLWYVLSSPSPCPHGGALSLHLLQDTTSLPLKKKRTASLLQWPKDLLRTLKKVKYYTYHSFAHNISIFMNILCTNIYLAYPLLWKIKSEITTWWKGRIRMYGLSNPRSERTSRCASAVDLPFLGIVLAKPPHCMASILLTKKHWMPTI